MIKLLLETGPKPPRFWNRKIDRDLATICLKCLEKNPARRYRSTLAEDLERWWKHELIAARRIGFVWRGTKWGAAQSEQGVACGGVGRAGRGRGMASLEKPTWPTDDDHRHRGLTI